MSCRSVVAAFIGSRRNAHPSGSNCLFAIREPPTEDLADDRTGRFNCAALRPYAQSPLRPKADSCVKPSPVNLNDGLSSAHTRCVSLRRAIRQRSCSSALPVRPPPSLRRARRRFYAARTTITPALRGLICHRRAHPSFVPDSAIALIYCVLIDDRKRCGSAAADDDIPFTLCCPASARRHHLGVLLPV